jgi:hypothetical protein
MMEAIHSSEMLVLTRATRRTIPKDGILNFNYLSFPKPFLTTRSDLWRSEENSTQAEVCLDAFLFTKFALS